MVSSRSGLVINARLGADNLLDPADYFTAAAGSRFQTARAARALPALDLLIIGLTPAWSLSPAGR